MGSWRRVPAQPPSCAVRCAPVPSGTYKGGYLGATRTVGQGTVITFTGTARPNRPELPQARVNFVAYELQGGTWVKILDRVVPVNLGSGKASLAITFDLTGHFYVRAQLVPMSVNANSGWTPVERYNVVVVSAGPRGS